MSSQVPYNPVLSQTLTDIPKPEMNPRIPTAAFGGTVADAFSNLGKVAEHAGDEIFNRAIALQNLNEEAKAKDADTKYMIEAGNLHAKFSAEQGKSAADLYPKYQQDLAEARTRIRGELKTPVAQKAYDANSLSTMGRTIFNGAGHAANEFKKYVAGASDARVEAQKNEVFQNNDDQTFKSSIGTVEDEIRRTQAPIAGWSPEKTDQVVNQAKSDLLARRIQGIARKDPIAAKQMFEANRDKLWYEDKNKTESIVQTQLYGTGSRMIAANINKDLFEPSQGKPPEKGLEERIQEGRDIADKQFPNDPQMKEYVTSAIRQGYQGHKRDVKDTEDNNRLTLANAINGDMGGKVPTTVEELRAIHPDVDKAWDDLPGTKKGAFLRALANNAKGDYGETEANYRTYQSLRGMANSTDEKDRLDFLNKNMIDEEMPRKWRTQLIKLQERLRQDSSADPRVNHAMRIITDYGIAPDPKDKEATNQFRGALQEALDVEQEQSQKPPDAKKIKEIGSRLIQQMADPTKFTFGGLLNRTTPMYERSVPSEIIDKIKADPRWKASGIEPDEKQIQREYLRMQYIKLYGTKSGAATETAPNVTINDPNPKAPVSK
jgi:hypothetical protein